MDHNDSTRSDNAQYENELINQRLTWLGTFEGLLFVANHYSTHPYLLPLVGFAIAVSVDVGICAANRRLTELDAQAHTDWKRFLMPGMAIPKIIAFAWAVILLENLRWLLSCFFRSPQPHAEFFNNLARYLF